MSSKTRRQVGRAVVVAALGAALGTGVLLSVSAVARAANACTTVTDTWHLAVKDGTHLMLNWSGKEIVEVLLVAKDGKVNDAPPAKYTLVNDAVVEVGPEGKVTFIGDLAACCGNPFAELGPGWGQRHDGSVKYSPDPISDGSFVTESGLFVSFTDDGKTLMAYSIDANGQSSLLKDGTYALSAADGAFTVKSGLVTFDSKPAFYCYASNH